MDRAPHSHSAYALGPPVPVSAPAAGGSAKQAVSSHGSTASNATQRPLAAPPYALTTAAATSTPAQALRTVLHIFASAWTTKVLLTLLSPRSRRGKSWLRILFDRNDLRLAAAVAAASGAFRGLSLAAASISARADARAAGILSPAEAASRSHRGATALVDKLAANPAVVRLVRSPQWSAIKGAVAGMCLALDPSADRRMQFALMLLVRAAYFGVRAWVYTPRIAAAPPAATAALEPVPAPGASPAVRSGVLPAPVDGRSAVAGGQGSAALHSAHVNGHTVVRVVPGAVAANALRRALDAGGVQAVWLFNAYCICYWAFVDPDVLPKSYYRSVLAISSNRERYGRNNKDITRGLTLLTEYMAKRPASLPFAHIPPSTNSLSHVKDFLSKAISSAAEDSELAEAAKYLETLPSLIPEGARHQFLGCAAVHPGEAGCASAGFRVFNLAFSKLLRVYSVINVALLVWGLAKHGLKLLKARNKRMRRERAKARRAAALAAAQPHDLVTGIAPSASLSDDVATPISPMSQPIPSPVGYPGVPPRSRSASSSSSTVSASYSVAKIEPTRKVLIALLRRFVVATLRSVVSISGFLFMFSYGICFFRRLFGREYQMNYGLAGLFASPAMLIEKISRIPELNTYCTTQVLQALWAWMLRAGWVKNLKHGDMLVIVPSTAILTLILDWHPHAAHGFYGPLFNSFFGTLPHRPASK
ncbi:hypothetical protein HK105_201225 [Polyrhizophydium stewartii]|uniref:Transmembrane protein 135 N-terminal domain-containing protein n=1 Tax=Polyrhizophydium stewartii TaxID=2732419 RepID=A0ABR4NHH3_9FUNG